LVQVVPPAADVVVDRVLGTQHPMSEQLPSFGAVLATGDPQAWRTLLAGHTSDETGHCRTCRRASGPADVWPCSLWSAADNARRIVAMAAPTTVRAR